MGSTFDSDRAGLIPPGLDPYLLYHRLCLLQPSLLVSLLSLYVIDTLCCHLFPENLDFLAYGHLVHYYTPPATGRICPLTTNLRM